MCPKMVTQKQQHVARDYLDPLLKESTAGPCEDASAPEPHDRENSVVNPRYRE